MQGGVRSISETRAVIRSRVFPPTLWTWFTDDDGEKKQTSRRGHVRTESTRCNAGSHFLYPTLHACPDTAKKEACENELHTYVHNTSEKDRTYLASASCHVSAAPRYELLE